MKALEGLRADPTVGLQATYGLGTALHNLQHEDPELAAEARTALTGELSSTTDPGTQAAALTALGNAGDPDTLQLIRGYVTSGEASVRAAAAQALRRIPGSEADALLAQLCTDADANVRYSAIDAIAERSPVAVLVAATSALAVTESALQVRAKAVNLVAEWYPKDSALGVTLRQIESGDTNADLRNVAKVALAQG